MRSDWSYPAPRFGILGAWDRFVGPGATRAEQLLSAVSAALAAAGVCVNAAVAGPGWSLIEYVLAALLAFDIVGGVVTNATASAKRWYHRDGQGRREQLGFVAVHGIHVAIVAALFLDWNIFYFVYAYGYILAGAVATLQVPIRLQRSVALLASVGAVFSQLYLLMPAPGVEWFLPLLALKLLVSHLTVEEPYVAWESHP